MRRLLLKSTLKDVLQLEGFRIDLEDSYQVYAAICEKFECETCGREDLYREPGAKFGKERWIAQAAKQARADGWKIGDWSKEGAMDCTAYCPNCKSEAEKPS